MIKISNRRSREKKIGVMIKTKEAILLFQSYFYHLAFLTFKLYIIKDRGIFTTSVEKKAYGRLLEDKNK